MLASKKLVPISTLIIAFSIIGFMKATAPGDKSCPSCDLQGRNFSGKDLSNVNLTGAILDSVDFSDAKLDGAVFSNASLKGAVFDGASIKSSERGPAVFHNADLSGARFDQTIFENSEFQYALLSGTLFENTDLRSVLFGPAIKFTQGETPKPPVFDGVVMSCEFPWLWDVLIIRNSELPDCESVPSKQKRRSQISGRTKRFKLDNKYRIKTESTTTRQFRIYVSAENGTDSDDCGTLDNPCRSITEGMSNCPSGSTCNVLVETGEYFPVEKISLVEGVNIRGGYVDGEPSVYQSAIYAAEGGQPIFSASGLSDTVVVSGFILNGSEATGNGKASKVIKLSDNSVLQLEYVDINAAKGSKGADGENAPDGIEGANGEDGTDSAGGKGGKGPNSYGGSGGAPSENSSSNCSLQWYLGCEISWTNTPHKGGSGSSLNNGAKAQGSEGAKGTGRQYGESTKTNDAISGSSGPYGTDVGKPGKTSSDTTGTFSGNSWTGNTGGNSSGGEAGGGGGGGGSGGPCVYCDLGCGNKTNHTGTAGGGGGAGGEGGGIAEGGQMGGASFGFMITDSKVIAGEEVRVTANSGGDGGNGGSGGAGGLGGSGGAPKSSNGDCGSSSSKTAGSGGKGGYGGSGAASCGAAGGNGGPAVGVALSGAAAVEGNIIFYIGKSGVPGKPGAAGVTVMDYGSIPITTSAGNPGEEGIEGIVKDTFKY